MDNCVCNVHIDTHFLDIYHRAISDSSIYINMKIRLKKDLLTISRAKREGDINKAYKKQNHMATAIEFNHVGKQYRLGLVSTE